MLGYNGIERGLEPPRVATKLEEILCLPASQSPIRRARRDSIRALRRHRRPYDGRTR